MLSKRNLPCPITHPEPQIESDRNSRIISDHSQILAINHQQTYKVQAKEMFWPPVFMYVEHAYCKPFSEKKKLVKNRNYIRKCVVFLDVVPQAMLKRIPCTDFQKIQQRLYIMENLFEC